MSSGWILLHRSLLDSRIWLKKPFSLGQAWADMLLLANYDDSFLLVRGIRIPVLRGQLGWSEPKMAARWGWSRTRVRTFLNLLKNEQQIEQQKNNITQIITIVNYDKYQKIEQQNRQQKDSRRTAEGQQKDANKEVKEYKEIKETPLIPLFKIPQNLNTQEFITVWNEWVEVRKSKKRCANWDRLFSAQLRWLDGFGLPIAIEILSLSIRNDYQGLVDPKKNGSRMLFQESFAEAKLRRTHEAGEAVLREAMQKSKEKGENNET